jgi:hypothetical protein
MKNADNIFNEATLGNTVNNSKRDGFVNYGDKTLKFICLCENNNVIIEKSPAASIAPEPFQLFTLVYHLCDDSIEIFAVPDAKYSDPFSRLLKRSSLTKNPISVSSIVGLKDEEYYHWTDFAIGVDITVFSRILKLIDCDDSTRLFYTEKGYELASSIPAPIIPKIQYIREIPPPTAFGSDEDSLRSCVGSLRPSPPRAKLFDEEIKLNYQASLISNLPEDLNRKFIIVYFVTDKTIQILEPPVKNSGFVGGVFLSRREVKSDNGEKILPKDFIIGGSIQILKHDFKITLVDTKTIQWMENKKYPQSDIYIILKKIAPFLDISASNGELKLDFENLANGSTYVTFEDLKTVLSKYCPTSYWSNNNNDNNNDNNNNNNNNDLESKSIEMESILNEHEIITITRAFSITTGGNENDNAFDYMEFIHRLELLK